MKNKKIIGFTSGYFDIMHPGHIMMLEECTRYCDFLLVGVNEYKTKTPQPDGRYKNDPIWTPEERLLMVSSCKYVGKAFLYDGEPDLYICQGWQEALIWVLGRSNYRPYNKKEIKNG